MCALDSVILGCEWTTERKTRTRAKLEEKIKCYKYLNIFRKLLTMYASYKLSWIYFDMLYQTLENKHTHAYARKSTYIVKMFAEKVATVM